MDYSPTDILNEVLERLKVLESENSSLRHMNRSSSYEPKISMPDKFSGDRGKFRGFLNQVELVFKLNPNRYCSDPSKVGVIGTLLCDKALAWFAPYLERGDPVLNNYQAFRSLLFSTFEEARSVTSAAQLSKLRQGSKPAFDYAADFRQLAADLDWNDSALIHQFRVGLNEDVKDLMLHHDIPSTLDAMVALTIQIDNRIFEHRQEQSASRRALPPRAIPRPQPAMVANQNHVPMDLDASHRGPLTEAEKEHRRLKNLCLYCGSSSHFRRDCPLAPKRNIRAADLSSGKPIGQ
jgi:Retrotransposon gag protein